MIAVVSVLSVIVRRSPVAVRILPTPIDRWQKSLFSQMTAPFVNIHQLYYRPCRPIEITNRSIITTKIKVAENPKFNESETQNLMNSDMQNLIIRNPVT